MWIVAWFRSLTFTVQESVIPPWSDDVLSFLGLWLCGTEIILCMNLELFLVN